MQPPPEPTELERQVRKLRLEVRKLRWTVVFCATAICVTIAGGERGFGLLLTLLALAAGLVVLLMCIAGSARLIADGWDAVSMRWQRHRWQAERNKPDEPK